MSTYSIQWEPAFRELLPEWPARQCLDCKYGPLPESGQ